MFQNTFSLIHSLKFYFQGAICIITLFSFAPQTHAQIIQPFTDVGVQATWKWRKPNLFEKGAQGSVLRLKLNSADKQCRDMEFVVVLYEGPVLVEKSPVVKLCIKPRGKRRVKFLFEREGMPKDGLEWHAEDIKVAICCSKKGGNSPDQ